MDSMEFPHKHAIDQNHKHANIRYMTHTDIVTELRRVGFSQDRIAKEAKCSQATISNIENGRHPNPTLDLIQKLKKARRALMSEARRIRRAA